MIHDLLGYLCAKLKGHTSCDREDNRWQQSTALYTMKLGN